jgi:hypothetical protein
VDMDGWLQSVRQYGRACFSDDNCGWCVQVVPNKMRCGDLYRLVARRYAPFLKVPVRSLIRHRQLQRQQQQQQLRHTTSGSSLSSLSAAPPSGSSSSAAAAQKGECKPSLCTTFVSNFSYYILPLMRPAIRRRRCGGGTSSTSRGLSGQYPGGPDRVRRHRRGDRRRHPRGRIHAAAHRRRPGRHSDVLALWLARALRR